MRLEDCLPHLLYEFSSESDLTRAIQEVSQNFTTNRGDLTRYLKDQRLVSAYTAFYLTTNFPKLREVARWLPRDWVEGLKSCDFVDLGAGPGTFSLAWRDLGGEGAVHQIETSELMQAQALKLWRGLGNQGLSQAKFARKLPGSFLLFGHSANEMGAPGAIRYIEEVSPDHVLFIEPGTKAFFPEMLKIRDHLLAAGFKVLFPCPEPLACPMRESGEDWCHQFITVRQEDDVERLSQLARKDRRHLPLIVHAYSKTFATKNPEERIVRVLPETKFSFEWEVCRNNILEHYQVMKRNLSKDRIKELGALTAGTPIETRLEKVVEKTKRVELLRIL